MGPETKTDCAVEGQQQFISVRPTDSTVIIGSESRGTHDHNLLPHDFGICTFHVFVHVCMYIYVLYASDR
jgi:hypothetical protein